MGLAGPVLICTCLVLGLRPVAGLGSGCSRAGGGVWCGVWWAGFSSTSFACHGLLLAVPVLSIVGSVLAYLPLFCPCPDLCYGYPSTSFVLGSCLFLGHPLGYCRASPLLSSAYYWALPWLCTALHPLLLGLRPVTCPVPGSCASGIYMGWCLYL